ncbi:MAG: hypothetical protein ACRDE7_04955 [Sphingobacterium sp.]
MKKLSYTILLLMSLTSVFAQKSKVPTLVNGFTIQVDGDLNEWQGNLTPIDADSSWSYAASQDGDYLYVALKITSQILVQEAARNGVKVSVNPKGKRKDGAILLFPNADAESKRALSNDENLAEMNIPKELINRSRGYLMKDFAHIVDGQLSFENNYGVLAKAQIDDQQNLLYESRIPVSAIGIKNVDQPVAIGIEIVTRYSQMQRALSTHARKMGNHYGQRPSSIKAPYKMKTEIWIVDKLNKN